MARRRGPDLGIVLGVAAAAFLFAWRGDLGPQPQEFARGLLGDSAGGCPAGWQRID